jgi:phosphatidylserine/phosphatidylglycerophosphate/cardiolipin synthase-like enzyme
VRSPEFLATIAGATGVPLTRGNRIDLLNNGDEFYPVMLREIAGRTVRQSRSRPTSIGRGYRPRVRRGSRRTGTAGVRVKILLDAIGSNSIGAGHSRHSRVGRMSACLVQPDQVVQHRDGSITARTASR